MKRAYLVSTGTELLLGSTMDTNSIFLSRKLAQIGVKVVGKSIVGDHADAIYDALKLGMKSADIIVTTGGLGPTLDDVTKEAACKAAGVETRLVQEEEERLRAFFARRNRPMPEINLKQAMFPVQAEILPNPLGTAPGMYLPVNNQVIICLPGPPRETESIYTHSVEPRLIRDWNLDEHQAVNRVVKILGPGESQVEEMLAEVINDAEHYHLALLARDGEIDVRVTAEGQDSEESETILEDIVHRISSIMGKAVFGYDDDTLSSVVANLLLKKGQTLAVAESCTSGLVGKMLTDRAGSSQYFWGGVMAYSNQAKQAILGVKEETLAEFGAVSRETALEMARGIRRQSQADFGLSITGIAGPGGGSSEKPVGTVFIAAVEENQEQVRELHFVGSREAIRMLAAKSSLDLLRRQLLQGER